MRIVSLLPSATEIVAALGLEDSLVGVTHECDFPPSVLDLPKVTRTHIPADASSAEIDRLVRERLKTGNALYALDHAALENLQPDLIVTQALCDVCAVAEDEVREAACRLPGSPRVVNLEPMTLGGMFDAMHEVARAADAEAQGDTAVAALRARVDAVAARSATLTNLPRVAFLEWLDPPFSGGHWNPELVRLAGGLDVLGHEGHPSRTLTWNDIRDARPDVLFIACCGFDAERTLKDVAEFNAKSVSGAASSFAPLASFALEPASSCERPVFVTDGSQYFNRPGPRLVDSLEILAHALHPGFHPLPSGLPPAIRLSDAPSPIAGT